MKKYLVVRFFLCFLLVFAAVSCKEDDEPIKKSISYHDYSGLIKEGLIAYYPLNGDSKDYSGNNNDGAIIGATSSVDRFGNLNSAYFFDGMDDLMKIPSFSELTMKEGTICFWIRLPSFVTNEQRAVLSQVNPAGSGFVFSINGFTGFWIDVKDGLKTSFGNRLYENDWSGQYMFMALAYSEDRIFTYHKGTLMTILNDDPEFQVFDPKEPIYFGKCLHADPEYLNYKGEIDDILVYNRVLTQDELAQLSNHYNELGKD